MKFFSSYSSGLSCSPEPFTFVSLLPLSLSLEATCLFYHFYALLSTPFFAFCFFYTLFPFSYLFLSILLRSFVLLIQKVTAVRRSVVTLDRLWYLDKKNKLTEQKLCESLEAPPRFELGIRVLQTHALPLGYVAIYNILYHYCHIYATFFRYNVFQIRNPPASGSLLTTTSDKESSRKRVPPLPQQSSGLSPFTMGPPSWQKMDPRGLEPRTDRLWADCSDQLS